MSVFNANSVDPDQMPHSVVYDLGLHYFHLPFFEAFLLNLVKCLNYLVMLIVLLINNSVLTSGPSCSKLMTSLVNDSLKFTISDTQIC